MYISQFVCLINDKVKVYTKDILGDMSTSTDIEKGLAIRQIEHDDTAFGVAIVHSCHPCESFLACNASGFSL